MLATPSISKNILLLYLHLLFKSNILYNFLTHIAITLTTFNEIYPNSCKIKIEKFNIIKKQF